MQQTPDDLIAEIRALMNELCDLGVRREYINFSRLKIVDLLPLRASIAEQLATRKKFLSRNSMEV